MSAIEVLPNVIVVGGGLAGLATALGLANTGTFQVDIVERRPNFDRLGATLGIGPNGMQALEELDPAGIMPILKKVGIELQSIGSSGLMLSWGIVRNALLDRVRSKGHLVRFHMGYTLNEIVDDPNATSVHATFVPSFDKKDRKSDDKGASCVAMLSLNGCLVVGADGVKSSVRIYLNGRLADEVGSTLWRGSVLVDPENPGTLDAEQHKILVGLLDKGVLPIRRLQAGPTTFAIFNFHSKIPGRMNWSISSFASNIPPNSHPWKFALEPFVENDDERKIIQALFSITGEDDLLHPIKFCIVKPPEQDGQGWGGRGRVIIIGDAAHAMRASTGQGGGMAFEDAVLLCRALRELVANESDDALSNFHAMSDLVLRVENERLVRVRRVWEVEYIMAEGGYGINPDKPGNPWTPEHQKWLHEGI